MPQRQSGKRIAFLQFFNKLQKKSLQKGELHIDQAQLSTQSVQYKNCKLPSNKSIGSGLNFPTHPARSTF